MQYPGRLQCFGTKCKPIHVSWVLFNKFVSFFRTFNIRCLLIAPNQMEFLIQGNINWFISPWTKWPPFYRQQNALLWIESFVFWFKFWLMFVPECQIDNKWALVHVMAWCGIGDKRQDITWTNADPVHRRIYASLGGEEMIFFFERWVKRKVCQIVNTNYLL